MTIATVSLSLPLSTLSDDEARLVNGMLDQLAIYEGTNSLKEKYYEGEQRVHNLGIAIPPHLATVETVVGWAGTTVDVLDERLEWQGWRSHTGNDYGLSEIYAQNGLNVDAGLGHLDALIYGTSFVVVGSGFAGEPSPLITVESPRTMTGLWDNRTRRLSAALGINGHDAGGQVNNVTLYLPNANIHLERSQGMWVIYDRSDHNLGRVLVTQMVNRPRASRMGGRSEITKAIRSYVDQGVRTMLGMEINREFYSFPQRYMMGADAEMFTDEAGNPIPGWEAVMSKMLVAPNNEDGQAPTVGQFTAASPAPYLDQIKGLAQLVAAEAGVPANYLGFVSDNPTSADAIRAAENRLIKRAERRQATLGRAWTEAGRLALLVRDGEIPADYNTISNKWRDPATPTRSAAADEAVKLSSGDDPIIPRDSTVLYDRIGLDPDEQAQLESEKRSQRADQRIADIRAAVEGTQ